jgi:hypothetical protein
MTLAENQANARIALKEPVSCARTGSNIMGETVQELKANKEKGLTEGGLH